MAFYGSDQRDYEARGDDARLFTRLYPEISYPLQRREGKAQRRLTFNGEPVGAELKADRIVFPNIAGSLLRFASIGGGGHRDSPTRSRFRRR